MSTRTFVIDTPDEQWNVPLRVVLADWEAAGALEALDEEVREHFGTGFTTHALRRIGELRRGRSVRISMFDVERTR